jgi:hypothetical protein
MKKEDIESILLANWYFTKCRIENPSSDRTELARKYLTKKVSKALLERANPTKAFYFISLVISVLLFRY